jgi:hypothetical protein
MLAGAVIGGVLVLHISIVAALGLTTALLLVAGLAAHWVSAASASWTAPT